MLNRRQFLQAAALAGAGVLVPWRLTERILYASAPQSAVYQEGTLQASTLTKWLDALPIPTVLKPTTTIRGIDYYDVTAFQSAHKFHSQLNPSTVWTYNGTYPGPSVVARRHKPVVMRYTNNLPINHFLPVDRTIHGANMGEPDGRMVTHLHGGLVPPEADGYPEEWITPGQTVSFYYPNMQPATTSWFHDHSLGITRLNVYAGMFAGYLIVDDFEASLNLPAGAFDVPLIIQDKAFNANGSLSYPAVGVTHPVWVPEFFGDAVVVNGKVWPFLEVEPRKYRFRIVNGVEARFWNLRLSTGQPMHVIAEEGGFLPQTATVNSLLVAPAERPQIIVDFSGMQGQTVTLTNDALAPYPDGEDLVPAEVMQFRVSKPLSSPDNSRIPGAMYQIRRIPAAEAAKVRNLTLEEIVDPEEEPIQVVLNGMHWHDPVTEQPKLGTVEIWQLINLTMDAHPIHVHQVQFQVLDRRPFDMEAYMQRYTSMGTGAMGSADKPAPDPFYNGPAEGPRPWESGFKDTVVALPGQVTRIAMRFGPWTGRYVWHCHILEHEDNDMMRPYDVIA